MPRLIRSAVLNNFVEVARSVGLDPYRMITEFHLPAACLTDSEIKISASKVGRLFEAAAARSGKIDFGLRLADRRTLSNLGARRCWSANNRRFARHLKCSSATCSCTASRWSLGCKSKMDSSC
jgi:hypothetical protein